MPVDVQLHRRMPHKLQWSPQRVIQTQTVDNLEPGDLGDEGGHQHTDEEQRHDCILEPELETLDDVGCHGAQDHVKENAERPE